MSVFVADKSPYFSIICYLGVQDCSMGISVVHLMFLQKPSVSTFHFSPGFWDLEVSESLLGGISNRPVLKSVPIDMWVHRWFGTLLMFTLWFCWLRCRRKSESMVNFNHWDNVRMDLSDIIRFYLERFTHEVNKGSSFQICSN